MHALTLAIVATIHLLLPAPKDIPYQVVPVLAVIDGSNCFTNAGEFVVLNNGKVVWRNWRSGMKPLPESFHLSAERLQALRALLPTADQKGPPRYLNSRPRTNHQPSISLSLPSDSGWRSWTAIGDYPDEKNLPLPIKIYSLLYDARANSPSVPHRPRYLYGKLIQLDQDDLNATPLPSDWFRSATLVRPGIYEFRLPGTEAEKLFATTKGRSDAVVTIGMKYYLLQHKYFLPGERHWKLGDY